MPFVCNKTMQKHFNAIHKISINITKTAESESTMGKKLPKKCGYISIDFKQELTKGWGGGKTVALSSKKSKTE